MESFVLGSELHPEDMYNIVDQTPIIEDWSPVVRCREALEHLLSEERPIYGVSTGFGQLANKWIDRNHLGQLQVNLIRSHAAGMGDVVPKEITKTAMKLLANSLAKGRSGIRRQTLELLISMIQKDIVPVSYQLGSLGASGDLAPLAHIALALIGEGEVHGDSRLSAQVLKENGLEPVTLEAKEGLALINGTHFITAYSLHILRDARKLLLQSAVSSMLTLEALKGTDAAFDDRIHELRKQKGQREVAKLLMKLLHGSHILESHHDPLVDHKVQDPYVLRCIPQVNGAIQDAVEYLEQIVSREVNAVTDNPLIFHESSEVISGGNFHAEPLALPLEMVNMALVELGNITERRLDRLVHPATTELPAFLASDPGVESGYMIAHYTAAAILNKMRVLAHPAVTDNTPTSGSQEDHVSMGMNSATKLYIVLGLARKIVAMEVLFAVRGLNMQQRPRSSDILENIIEYINSKIPYVAEDHYTRKDLIRAEELLLSPEFSKFLEDQLT